MASRVAARPSEDTDWQTPLQYVQAGRCVMHRIDLDPATSLQANERIGATHIFTEKDNGLLQPWFGCIWCNPPYGLHPSGKSNMALWTQKLLGEVEQGHVEEAIFLVTAVPDRKWFKPLVQYPICFADHQILFHKPDGTHAHHAYGSCFVYIGPNKDAFVEEFSAFGDVLVRVAPKREQLHLF